MCTKYLYFRSQILALTEAFSPLNVWDFYDKKEKT